jgi:site-specific recombinase XerD
MSKNNVATFSEATVSWLCSKPDLADVSRMAYRGEVNRMAEHLVQAGISNVHAVSRQDWWGYLTSLERGRVGVETKRLEELRPSSIQQARRITRDFFMWALEGRAIDWIPHLPGLEIQAEKNKGSSTGSKEISTDLIRILVGEEKCEGMIECRACLVLNLVFWGAMKPIELASLKVRDIHVGRERIACSLPKREVVLPKHVGRLWKDYVSYRRDAHKVSLQEQSPLIAQIKREDAVSLWGIWAIFKAWHKSSTLREEEYICPRQLRAIYLEMICVDGKNRLALICRYGGMKEQRIKASDTPPPQSTMVSINEEVTQQLKTHQAELEAPFLAQLQEMLSAAKSKYRNRLRKAEDL